MRDFDYDTHLLTFITHDFDRMRMDRFAKRPKPVVGVRDGRVEALNAPVGDVTAFEQWWLINGVGRILRPFRFLDLAATVNDSLARPEPLQHGSSRQPSPAPDSTYRETFQAIVRELKSDADRRSTRLVFVHLPQITEYNPRPGSEEMRDWLSAVSADAEVDYWMR